jgi:hypothetical protein
MLPTDRSPNPTTAPAAALSAVRLITAAAAIAGAAMLSACAGGPSFMEHGGLTGVDSTAWEGAARPKPAPVAAASYKPGAAPLLPPVPEDTAGLAPIRVSVLSQ